MNCGKQFEIGNWFLTDNQWSKEKYNKFVSEILQIMQVISELL